jgi:hypothetical protein
MIGKILAPLSLKKGFFCETTRMSIVTAVEVGETEPIFFCFFENIFQNVPVVLLG